MRARRLVYLIAPSVVVSACSLTSLEGFSGGTPPDGTPNRPGDGGPEIDAPAADTSTTPPPTTGYRATVLTDRPVAYWRFEETAGTTFKDEIGGLQAIATGSCAPGSVSTAGLSGLGLAFDGASCRLDLGRAFAFDGTAPFTIEVWIRHTGVNQYQHLFTHQTRDGANPIQGYALLLDPSGRAYIERVVDRAIFATAQVRVPPSTFAHVVGVYDGGQLLLYINGALRETTDDARPLITTSARTIVGENSTSMGWFAGTMDELAIYDRALPAETISAHHALGISTTQ
jgi:hypothetical protein